MSNERAGQTLQATALVHEVYLRLVGSADVSWASRAQFFSAAAQAMRRILVERARARGRLKRGGGAQRVELDEQAAVTETPRTDLVALDGALDRLAAISPRKCDVVMLKFFAGMTNDEVAAALGVSSATVRNEWTFAKAWLLSELEREAG
jgi:RNA polymerase sigma factor (TIGR02999 family)